MGPIGASGDVAATDEGTGVRVVPDALGSTRIRVSIGRLGYTTLAGLRFRQSVMLNIWDDGTVEVDEAGVWAKGEDGVTYVSRRMPLTPRPAVVMVKAPPTKMPKPVELPDAERKERAAAIELGVARTLLKDGKPDQARAMCTEILKKYPHTQAAAEAKKLLGD